VRVRPARTSCSSPGPNTYDKPRSSPRVGRSDPSLARRDIKRLAEGSLLPGRGFDVVADDVLWGEDASETLSIAEQRGACATFIEQDIADIAGHEPFVSEIRENLAGRAQALEDLVVSSFMRGAVDPGHRGCVYGRKRACGRPARFKPTPRNACPSA
jgi:hypothetical protein